MELESLPAEDVLMEQAFDRAREEGWSLSADQARELAVRVGEFLQSPWGTGTQTGRTESDFQGIPRLVAASIRKKTRGPT